MLKANLTNEIHSIRFAYACTELVYRRITLYHFVSLRKMTTLPDQGLSLKSVDIDVEILA